VGAEVYASRPPAVRLVARPFPPRATHRGDVHRSSQSTIWRWPNARRLTVGRILKASTRGMPESCSCGPMAGNFYDVRASMWSVKQLLVRDRYAPAFDPAPRGARNGRLAEAAPPSHPPLLTVPPLTHWRRTRSRLFAVDPFATASFLFSFRLHVIPFLFLVAKPEPWLGRGYTSDKRRACRDASSVRGVITRPSYMLDPCFCAEPIAAAGCF